MSPILTVALLAVMAFAVASTAQAAELDEIVTRAPVTWPEQVAVEIPEQVRSEAGPGDRLLPSQILEGEFDMIGRPRTPDSERL